MRLIPLIGSLLFLIQIDFAEAQNLQRAQDYQKERQKQLEKFNEESENETVETPLSNNDYQPSAPKKKSLDEMMASPSAEQIEALKSVEIPEVQEKSYFHKLKRAYGCFREFLSGALNNRALNIDESVHCTTASNSAEVCSSREASRNEVKIKSLKDEFYACLDRD